MAEIHTKKEKSGYKFCPVSGFVRIPEFFQIHNLGMKTYDDPHVPNVSPDQVFQKPNFGENYSRKTICDVNITKFTSLTYLYLEILTIVWSICVY